MKFISQSINRVILFPIVISTHLQLLTTLRAHKIHVINHTTPAFWSIWTNLSWQEIWCVCLQHNSVERDFADSISNLSGPGVGDQGCESYIQVGELCQEWLNHWITVGETVPAPHKNNKEKKSEKNKNHRLLAIQFNEKLTESLLTFYTHWCTVYIM